MLVIGMAILTILALVVAILWLPTYLFSGLELFGTVTKGLERLEHLKQ